MALDDLAGKALGTPVYNLLGGALRDGPTVYLDRSGPLDPSDLGAWRELALRSVAEGFRALKFDVEHVAPELTADPWNRTMTFRQVGAVVERIAAVRQAAGDEIEIALDCHMSYDVETAVRLARAISELDVKWLEDPIPITSPTSLAEVRSRSPVPICCGEMFVPEQFRLFVEARACDIVHPDVLFVGGLHAARRVADYADLHYLPMAMHNNGSALATVAAAHVATASPNFISLEFHFFDATWLKELIRRDRPLFEEGRLWLSDAPGLGLTLDEDVCREHLAPGETLG